MRFAGGRYIGAFAVIVAWGFLLALYFRDGTDWSLWVAYAVSPLIGWRMAYHVHLFGVEEPIDEALKRKARVTQVATTVGFLALTSVAWLL